MIYNELELNLSSQLYENSFTIVHFYHDSVEIFFFN